MEQQKIKKIHIKKRRTDQIKIKVKRINAFTDKINGGNPAGVLLDAPHLLENQMKDITRELKVSETAFVYPSNIVDYKVLFFSPEVEVELCGHATIATFYTMAYEEILPQKNYTLIQRSLNTWQKRIQLYWT